MELSRLPATPPGQNVPLDKLVESKGHSEAEKLAEASRQFESVLLRQIVGQARKTVVSSKLSDNSVSAGIYRDMVTEQLAEGISKSGSFGLARSLQSQLSHQLSAQKNPEPPAPDNAGPDGANRSLHD